MYYCCDVASVVRLDKMSSYVFIMYRIFIIILYDICNDSLVPSCNIKEKLRPRRKLHTKKFHKYYRTSVFVYIYIYIYIHIYIYIFGFQKSGSTLVNFPRGLCFCLYLFVCLFFNRITQKRLNWFPWHFVEGRGMSRGTSHYMLVLIWIKGDIKSSFFHPP